MFLIKYVALLRGINVGGHKKVPMIELRALFESLGFTHVSTYINSGNVIFFSDSPDTENIIDTIRTGVLRNFGFDINVLLRDTKSIQDICEAVPPNWIKIGNHLPQVIFLSRDLDRADILDSLPLGTKTSSVKYASSALLWDMETDTYMKSPLYKYISKKDIAQKVTVRTLGTVQKLRDMMM